MKRLGTLLIAACALAASALPALADMDPVNTVATGCEKELSTYCKDVTPGAGRVLACLYAHGDKLSGRCEYALYDASIQLERFLSAVSYMAEECKDDLRQYCAAVPAGQGRLLDCLDKNQAKVSERCKQAVRDVAAKK